MLRLGGSLQGKALIAQFLKHLQDLIGLSLCPLREHFDVVVGSDIGMSNSVAIQALLTAVEGAFFAQTIFLESWSLADCRYHFRHLESPKFKKRSVVSFGKDLAWDLSRTRHFNGPRVVLLVKDRAYSNAGPGAGVG